MRTLNLEEDPYNEAKLPHCDFMLPEDYIHVWEIDLGSCQLVIGQLESILIPEELTRAYRYRSEESKLAFVATRALLRILLASYLDKPLQEVKLTFGSHGKPAITGIATANFNVSHSGSRALIAVAKSISIGVDIEQNLPMRDFESIAQSFFCASEAQMLMSLPPSERQSSFYRCWTRKEAYVKCVGHGLSIPLNHFQVTLLPGDTARFVHMAGDYEAAHHLTLTDISPDEGYIAALAYRGRRRAVSFRSIRNPEEMLARYWEVLHGSRTNVRAFQVTKRIIRC